MLVEILLVRPTRPQRASRVESSGRLRPSVSAAKKALALLRRVRPSELVMSERASGTFDLPTGPIGQHLANGGTRDWQKKPAWLFSERVSDRTIFTVVLLLLLF